MRRLALAGLVIGVAGCGSVAPGGTLWVGPTFATLDPAAPRAAAVLTDGTGRILQVYATTPVVPAGAHVERIPGVFAVPGLGDAHVHLEGIGQTSEMVDLQNTTSVVEVRARIAAFASAHPGLSILSGVNWDQTRFAPPVFPTAADLAGADPAGRPIVLWRVDGHALWLDAAAMALATQRLPGYFAQAADGATAAHASNERILYNDDGAGSGVVVDPDPRLWAALVPAPTEVELARWVEAALATLSAQGLVEVHDMSVTVAELAVLVRLAARPEGLPLRVVVYLKREPASWTWLEAHAPGPVVLGPDLEVRGVKLFADGALGSRGAALKAPYSDESGHLGQPVDASGLVAESLHAQRLGYQVAIHAIGDAANANALTALESAREAPGVTGRSLRHRIEHVQVLDLANDLARLRASDAVASMQPTHATSDMRWAEARLGPDRIQGAYAWASLLRAGVSLAFGSDAPVESSDPRLGLWAATTRRAPGDADAQHGWYIGQCLTLDEALRAFSAGVAYAAEGEAERGAVAVGRQLELSIFDKVVAAPSDLDPGAAGHATIVGTVRRARFQPVR